MLHSVLDRVVWRHGGRGGEEVARGKVSSERPDSMRLPALPGRGHN